MYRRVFLAAAFLVAGSAAVSAQTSADAVRAWVSAIDETPEWSARYSTLTEDATNDSAVVTELVIYSEAEGGVRFDFDTVTVKGLAQHTGEGFGAEEIGIDRVAVTGKYFTATLERTSLSGLFIPAVIAAVFASDEPPAVIARIHELVAGLRLDRARIDNISGGYEVLGESNEVTYEGLELSGLANGRVERMKSGVSRTVADTPEGPVVAVVQGVETYGSEFGAMLRLLDPYNPPEGDDAWRTVLALAVYRGMAWAQGEAKVAMDEIAMENFRMRKPPPGYAPALKRLLEEGEIPEAERERFSAHLAIDFLESFAIGRISVRNVDATGPDVDRVRLGGFAISDLSLAQIGEISVDNLSVSVPDQGDFSLERFALGDLVIPSAEAMRAAVDAERDGREVDPLTLIPQLGFVELLRATAALPDAVTGKLDRLRLELRDHVKSIPTSASADLRGLEFPVSALPDSDAREMFAGIGIDRISVNYGYRVRWREPDERLIVDDVHVEIEDLGAVTVSLTLGGLKREMFNVTYDPERLTEDLTFESARIVFEDRSVTDRALRFFAQQRGADPETLRQETADAIPLTLRLAIDNEGLNAKIAPALKAFLLKPGRLTVTLRAKEPLPIAALVAVGGLAPEQLSNMVDIEVQQE